MELKRIVTHKGQAHRDDFLAVGLALALFGDAPVFRRDPTEEELEDAEVLILDVGGRHEPEKGNFDHHQLPKDAKAECALSLFSRAAGVEEDLRFQDWYDFTKVLDAKGPFFLAKTRGWGEFPFEVMSPVEDALLEVFQGFEEVPAEFRALLATVGEKVLNKAKAFAEGVRRVASLPKVEVNGVEVLINESTSTVGLQKGRDLLVAEGHNVGACVSHDERDNGWALYRFNDHEAVDFTRIKNDERVLFAHERGFIAKTKERIPLDEVMELLRVSIQ